MMIQPRKLVGAGCSELFEGPWRQEKPVRCLFSLKGTWWACKDASSYSLHEENPFSCKGEARLNFSTRGGRGKVASEKENVAENYYMRKFSRVGWVPKILARFWKRCRMA